MKLSEPMKVCKLCFKDFDDYSLLQLINKNICVCKRCYEEIRAKFISFEVLGYKALSIYEYDEKIQALLYQFKACFDIELRKLFLDRYIRELKMLYFGYTVVPIPSYPKDDEIREFNHVEEMFKELKLPVLKLLTKTKRIKQATSVSCNRKKMKRYLSLVDTPNLSEKKILIVDDVYTTGSTMKSAIELIKTLNPKKIKVLVMSKTKLR